MSDLLKVKANFEYYETVTDGSRCTACEEMILGKMFQLVVFINNEPVYSRFKYCESCHTIENDKC